MEAAAIERLFASPLTIPVCGMSTFLRVKASIRMCSMPLPCFAFRSASAFSIASAIASFVASRMFISSILLLSLMPMPIASARSLIESKSSSLFFSESFLESSTPRTSKSSGRTTQAVTTGPASGPLPTSSTPAIYVMPRSRSLFSYSCMVMSFSASIFSLSAFVMLFT